MRFFGITNLIPLTHPSPLWKWMGEGGIKSQIYNLKSAMAVYLILFTIFSAALTKSGPISLIHLS